MTAHPPIFAGRFLADHRIRSTPFGSVADWTVEDLDADDTTIVASRAVLLGRDHEALAQVVRDAALRAVREARVCDETPLYAELGGAS